MTTTALSGEARWTDRGLVFRDGASSLVAPLQKQFTKVIGEVSDVDELGRWVGGLTAGHQSKGTPVAGPFAAVHVDPNDQRVTLVTDAFGVQPLFYWSDRERLVFATRLEDLRRLVGMPLDLDWTAVAHYLNLLHVPGSSTIFKGVSVMPPGSMARFSRGKADVITYWDVTYPADLAASEAELARQLREEIERAVGTSWPGDLRADRIGSFLSGGTDSGTIAGLGVRVVPALKAYSIGFHEGGYDELGYAKILARHYHLTHHIHHLTVDDTLESIPLLVEGADQPFGNSSAVASWRCARLARDTGVELLLAGDGGDEIFGGNARYAKDRAYALYHRLPRWSRQLMAALLDGLPLETRFVNRVKNFAYRGNLAHPERLFSDDAMFTRWWSRLASQDLRAKVSDAASLALVRGHYDRAQASSELDRWLYVDLKTVLWGNDLVKVVLAGRVAGVRVRFPLLDPRLAAFTGRLRPDLKVRGIEKRYLFKRAVGDVLPKEILTKPKHGFGVPIAEWLRTDRRIREAVLDPILDSRSVVRQFIDARGLQWVVDRHVRGLWDHGNWLWAVMMLERWVASRRGTHAVR